MAKLVYDAAGVQTTLSTLNLASSYLDGTAGAISGAISTVMGARNIHWIGGLDFSGFAEAATECQGYIEEQSTLIKGKAADIEKYNEEVGAAGLLTRCGATVLMAGLKIGEGFATAGEQLVDGVVSGVGWLVGLFNKDAQNKIGEYVKKDHVGDFFANQYESGALSGINKYSYMSANGTAATLFKCVGIGAGYAAAAAAGGAIAGAVSTATGTAAAGTTLASNVLTSAKAASQSLKLAAGLAGLGGVGSGTQAGLQQGLSYNQAFGKGLVTGAVQAGTVVAVNYAIRGISKAINTFKASKAASAAGNTADDMASAAGSNPSGGNTSGSNAAGTFADDVKIGEIVDDAASTASNASGAANATGNVADDAAAIADDLLKGNAPDGIKIVGKAVSPTGQEMVIVENAAGKFAAVAKNGEQALGTMVDDLDDFVSQLVKNGNQYDDIAGILNKTTAAGAGVVDDMAAASGANNITSLALRQTDDVGVGLLNSADDAVQQLPQYSSVPSNMGLAVVDDATNALAVIDDVPTGLAVIDDVPTGLVPTTPPVVPTIPPVVPTTPVIVPTTPIVTTAATALVPPLIHTALPPESGEILDVPSPITIVETPSDPVPVPGTEAIITTDPPTVPVTTPPETTPPTSYPTTPGSGPGTTAPTSPTSVSTSAPTTPIVTPDVPQQDDEYVPIPNTGLSKRGGLGDYAAPIAVGVASGLATGLAGIAATKSYKNYKKEKDEDDDESEEDNSEE